MRRLACSVLAALGIAATAPVGGWEKFAGNPVLGNDRLGTCFDVNVVTNGPAPYTMYFSWRPKSAIALVRSHDGVTWTQEPEICLEADKTSGWEDYVNRACTVRKDGVWHMWYSGQVFADSGWANGWSRIGYAVSKDGLTWQKRPEPIFTHGDATGWDCDRVGVCEVHPLPDGRWAMFYIGYSDIDTARVGCAISADGITGWKRLPQNPIVAPGVGTWDASACYKPSVVRDEKNGRWLLWYNGRNGAPEYVGMAVHRGLDLEAPDRLDVRN